MSARRDVSMTPDEVAGFLSRPSTGVLTTLDRDGWPHSSAMWFVLQDDRIMMWTYSKSQKAANLRRDPKAAFLVEDGSDYSELRGVLIRGRAELTDDPDIVSGIGRRLYELYTEPKTGIAYEEGPHLEVERQTPKRVGVVLPIERTSSWDFRKL